ncbi:MAG: SDR family NAD(P)-dependent oxidoreductase, partial [bacterium]
MTLDGLAGKLGIVTGAARGIGLAIAQVLAANGMRVAMLDNRGQELEEAARRIPEASGFVVDVTDRASVESTFAAIEQRLGPVYALVNNAGIISWKTFEEGTEIEWDRAMAVNAKGVYLCCRAVYG